MKSNILVIVLILSLFGQNNIHAESISEAWHSFKKAWDETFQLDRQDNNNNNYQRKSDEDYLNQFSEELCPGYLTNHKRKCFIPREDIAEILRIAREQLNQLEEVEKTEDRVNQEIKRAILTQHEKRALALTMQMITNNEKILAIVKSENNNLHVALEKSIVLNPQSVTPFFSDALRKRIEKSITYPQNNEPSAYSVTIQEFLLQFTHDLQGIPDNDITNIITLIRQELSNKRILDLETLNQIARAVIPSYVQRNVIHIVLEYTDDHEKAEILGTSCYNNVIAHMERTEHINGQALAQFFGSSLDTMIIKELRYLQK